MREEGVARSGHGGSQEDPVPGLSGHMCHIVHCSPTGITVAGKRAVSVPGGSGGGFMHGFPSGRPVR
ncbi:hypothetical protein GCM10010524_47080 [Streptomyces mexicanus]